ncbi:hypothetical protein ACFUMH_04115 [Cellulomonas sp. NPDC057328]|uniref:hypothetical protein n=1 Tax=Cellulomonas sp. NPDC057328 TaxID=3346101 RepID=UPI00363DFB36
MAETDPSVDHRERQRQLDQARIDTFVVRARRIEAHSLAQDLDRLAQLSGGAMQITYRDGRTTISFDYPPEEQVESAAARVRPLLLDDVSMLNVLKAIKSLTAHSDHREMIHTWVKTRREAWNQRTGKVPSDSGFVAFVHSPTSGESDATDHLQLALAWIYGDVVHHDPEHLERTKPWGVGERFRAAVPLVAYLMIEAINVLANIREMDKQGWLTVSAEALTVPVVAEDHYEREVELYVGEVGTPKPNSATEPLEGHWQTFDPAGLFGARGDAEAPTERPAE